MSLVWDCGVGSLPDKGVRHLELSVVVPCYNEELVLPELLRRVALACEAEKVADYELILVDDGSSDSTPQLIEDACHKDRRVVGVVLARNHGHQLALTAGLSQARGQRILVLDADLQDPPELLGKMMAKLDEGFDVVYGKRISRDGESWIKRATAYRFYRFMQALSDVPIPEDTGDFRLMTRRVLDVFLSMPEQDRYIRGMISWIGFNQTSLEYEREARFDGETKYPLRKMLALATAGITGFSIKPLRLSIYMGFLLAFSALLFGFRVLYSYYSGNTIQGWTSLTLVALIIGAAQLLVVGIIGEYLGKLYMESKRRPIFIIERVIRVSKDGQKQEVLPLSKTSQAKGTDRRSPLTSAPAAFGTGGEPQMPNRLHPSQGPR